MNVLILHRIPYHKIEYHRSINHDTHNVIYVGQEQKLGNIPDTLRCQKWVRGKEQDASEIVDLIHNARQGIDCVISMSEYELMTAAEVRELLNIAGPTKAQVEKVRNKIAMKLAVMESGLRVPYFASLADFLAEPLTSALPVGSSLILKPVDGASSEGVEQYSDRGLLVAEIEKRQIEGKWSAKDIDRYQVEEFVEGPILHFDGLMDNGYLKAFAGSRYVGTCLGFANGQPLGSVQFDTPQDYFNWVVRILKAVDLKNGSFHLEAIETAQGLCFLEIANRVGGAEVVETFERATGINLPARELSVALGEDCGLEHIVVSSATTMKYGWFVFPGHHYDHDYCRVDGYTDVAASPYMMKLQMLAQDKKLTKHITYQAVEVPMAGILGGDNSGALVHEMKRIFGTVSISPISM